MQLRVEAEEAHVVHLVALVLLLVMVVEVEVDKAQMLANLKVTQVQTVLRVLFTF